MVFHGLGRYTMLPYVDAMNRTRLAILAAAPLLAVLAATAASARTAPGGTYTVTSGHGRITITIGSNPTKYNVRAEAVCFSATTYGPWHTSGSSTAICPVDDTLAGGNAQYDETHKYTIHAWAPGDPLTGSW